MNWKSIKTAPKDGTEIDLWIVDPLMPMEFREATCWWQDDEWKTADGIAEIGPRYATHWMPLPPPNAEAHRETCQEPNHSAELCDVAQLQRLRYVGGMQSSTLRNLVLNKGMQLQDAQYRESVERLISEWDDLMVQAFRAADAAHNAQFYSPAAPGTED